MHVMCSYSCACNLCRPDEDKILICELFLSIKCTWTRAAGENFTVVPYYPNQFQWPKNGKK